MRAYPSFMYIANHVLLFYLILFKRGARLPVASVAIRMHHFITIASFFLFLLFELKSTKVTGLPLTCSCTRSTRFWWFLVDWSYACAVTSCNDHYLIWHITVSYDHTIEPHNNQPPLINFSAQVHAFWYPQCWNWPKNG